MWEYLPICCAIPEDVEEVRANDDSITKRFRIYNWARVIESSSPTQMSFLRRIDVEDDIKNGKGGAGPSGHTSVQ